ncbi:MAG TPA: amino acid adenylation domain-containing protein [Thermoanaerobaculia bacterium]|nr:amino acid adenylation domain-containing protein [Thermoanaerobaculia bacterium]
MKLLLLQLLDYRFPFGGAHKCNRLLMEAFAARGHVCEVVAPGYETTRPRPDERERLLENLSAAGIPILEAGEDLVVYRLNGVLVHATVSEFSLADYARIYGYLAARVEAMVPDWVLVSEDHTGLFLGAALELAAGRVVYLAHAQPTLPFGPEAFDQDPAKAKLFGSLAGILTVSDYVKGYIRRWGGFDSTVIALPAYGAPPYPHRGDFTRGAVTLVNASGLKGLPIFLDLAAAFPDVAFAAVASWGTGEAERMALAALPNVTVREPRPDVDEILADARVLLVPSLWGEAFGMIAVEAMLRGIPVLASDLGGLPEAKLGIDYLLPVTPIAEYRRTSPFEKPVPIIPPQDCAPWRRALARVLTDREHYERLSRESRSAAHAFVEGLGAHRFEAYFAELAGQLRKSVRAAPLAQASVPEGRPSAALGGRLERLSSEQRTLLALRLAQKRGAGRGGIPRLPRGSEDDFPLSFTQERFWFLEQLRDANDSGGHAVEAYTVTVAAYRLSGAFRRDLLERSLNDLVRRHEVFRTSFPEVGGLPRQRVRPEGRIPLAVESLRHLGAASGLAAVQERILAEYRRGFALEEAPLLRVLLLELADDERILAFTLHHLIYDGWSVPIFLAELTELYRAHLAGQPPVLPDLPIQYADFAAWQRQWLAGDRLDSLLAYWRGQLAGAPAVLDLPIDRARPRRQTFRGSHCSFALGGDLTERLRELARAEGVSLSMVLLAGFDVLLYRYTQESDLVVGVPTAGREQTETEGLIGAFINLLAIRTRVLGARTLRQLLPEVRRALLEGAEHQALPFEKLVAELAPVRDLSRHPVFQVLFAFNRLAGEGIRFGDAAATWYEAGVRHARVDLALEVSEEPVSGITVTLEFSTDLFDPATIDRMAGQLRVLFASLAERPDGAVAHLALLTPEERRALLPESSPPRWQLAEAGVHQLFALQAARQPDALAIVTPAERITYGALDRLADRVGTRLSAALPVVPDGEGVGPVALLLPNGVHHVAAMIGAQKAGAHFVCLDPEHPAARLRQIVEDLRPKVLLTNAEATAVHTELLRSLATEPGLAIDTMEAIAARPWRACPVVPGTAADPVYVAYTSGSTGRPKGIVQTQGGFRYLVEWFAAHFGLAPGERVAQWISVGHDPCYVEVWSGLAAGATLSIAPPEIRQDPVRLHGWIGSEDIAVIQMTPSLCRQLLDREIGGAAAAALAGRSALRAVLLTGEALPVALARQWLDHFGLRPALHNVYGPTESILVTSQRVDTVEAAAVAIPVGAPVAGCRLFVLDGNGEACPTGVPGEIFVRSPFLASGYHGMPQATAAAFGQNPLHACYPDRVYRTGDLGRWRADGTLELRGRADRQVKLRGQRLEPEEVEAALARHPTIAECAVGLRTAVDGGEQLVGYAVVRGDIAASALREWLRGELPSFMVPDLLVLVAALPRTATGKVDHGALAGIAAAVPDRGAAAAAPESGDEQLVAAVFAECLGREQVGRHDDFFESGGHSLLAARAANRLREHYLIDIRVRDVFTHPTVAGLAGFVAEQRGRQEQVDFVAQLHQLLEQVHSVSDEEAARLLSDLAHPSA